MIFVDTSALVALAVKSDRFHKAALKFRTSNADKEFLTSNLIILESLGWVRYKSGRKKAVELGKNLLSETGLRIERLTKRDEEKAWKLFQELNGRGISMVDCTSFVAMKRLKIKETFTFDEDFKKLGFKVFPYSPEAL